MPNDIRYENLPLGWVHVLIESNFYDNCLQDYGSDLATVIFNWTCHNDANTFDQHRDIIKENFLNRRNKQQFRFFYRLEKIIRLYQYWHKNQRWRDPVVAIPNNETHYYAHPGKDRLLVMKSQQITHYRFLVVDRSYITEDNLERLKPHWGGYAQNLSIDTKIFDKEHKTLLNKDNIDVILEYSMIKAWLASKMDLKSFVKADSRQMAVRKILDK